jgi:hypothetical protein
MFLLGGSYHDRDNPANSVEPHNGKTTVLMALVCNRKEGKEQSSSTGGLRSSGDDNDDDDDEYFLRRNWYRMYRESKIIVT